MEFMVAQKKDLVITSTNFNSLSEHRRLAIQQCQSQTYQRWEYTPPGANCGASVSIFVIPMAQILRSVLPDTFCTSSMYNLSITIPNILQQEIDRFRAQLNFFQGVSTSLICHIMSMIFLPNALFPAADLYTLVVLYSLS